MAATLQRRSAWGLDYDRATPWWERAACKETGHLHLARQTPGLPGTAQAQARHICIAHCPVLAQCEADIADRPPHGITQAGVLYAEGSTRRGKAADIQPADPGCGLWCIGMPAIHGGAS